jgi:hypothetical protein
VPAREHAAHADPAEGSGEREEREGEELAAQAQLNRTTRRRRAT